MLKLKLRSRHRHSYSIKIIKTVLFMLNYIMLSLKATMVDVYRTKPIIWTWMMISGTWNKFPNDYGYELERVRKLEYELC